MLRIINKLFCVLVFLPFLNAFAMEDGDYQIICHTKNRGMRALEYAGRVSLEEVSNSGDQKWTIQRVHTGHFGEAYYRIYWNVGSDGRNVHSNHRYLEAFPGKDKIVKAKSWENAPDQHWLIEAAGNGKFLISCNTQNKGLKYLEAFPGDGVVRPVDRNCGEVDQEWILERIWHPEDLNYCRFSLVSFMISEPY